MLFHSGLRARRRFAAQDDALRGTHNAEGAKVASG